MEKAFKVISEMSKEDILADYAICGAVATIYYTEPFDTFGPDITAAVFALGFATRAAMSFGGVRPGDAKRILMYNRHRVFAFVLTFGEVTDEWYATAAGAINYGFPTIADTDIPTIYPRGICLYEHVVPNIPHSEIVEKALQVRG